MMKYIFLLIALSITASCKTMNGKDDKDDNEVNAYWKKDYPNKKYKNVRKLDRKLIIYNTTNKRACYTVTEIQLVPMWKYTTEGWYCVPPNKKVYLKIKSRSAYMSTNSNFSIYSANEVPTRLVCVQIYDAFISEERPGARYKNNPYILYNNKFKNKLKVYEGKYCSQKKWQLYKGYRVRTGKEVQIRDKL